MNLICIINFGLDCNTPVGFTTGLPHSDEVGDHMSYLRDKAISTLRQLHLVYRRSRKGEWIECETPIGTYFFQQPHKELRTSTCPKTIIATRAKAQVCEKVCRFINNPEYLLTQTKDKVAQLRKGYQQMQQEEPYLQEKIKKLAAER